MTPPIRPGPAAAATPESCAKPMPAFFLAAPTIPSSASTWARAAMSGTTPPNGACSSFCERTILDKIRPAPSVEPLNHGGRRFVAGGLDAEDQGWLAVIQFEP